LGEITSTTVFDTRDNVMLSATYRRPTEKFLVTILLTYKRTTFHIHSTFHTIKQTA